MSSENFHLLLAQLFLGLVNGAFYALLSLGMALIFGLLGIVNFSHGALFMLGAYFAWVLLEFLGIGYWPALILAPLIVAILGLVIERFLIRPLYKRAEEYSLLLTFGLGLLIEGTLSKMHGSSGLPYEVPASLQGVWNFGNVFMPLYRIWVLVFSIVVCAVFYVLVEKTSLGARLRAIRENPKLCEALGINTKKYLALSFAGASFLAAVAGVMAAPIFQVTPTMGADFIMIVFAVVVVGGMSSLRGVIAAGFALGALEGIAKVFMPEMSQMVIYLAMGLFLLFLPQERQGKEKI